VTISDWIHLKDMSKIKIKSTKLKQQELSFLQKNHLIGNRGLAGSGGD
jgi:hypothetical protein